MQTVKIMVCGACQKGKQTKVQHKNTADILISRPLEYMDLMGSTQTESIGRKEYIMIIVNDYSRYTWVILLKDKSESFDLIGKLFRRLQEKKRTIYL